MEISSLSTRFFDSKGNWIHPPKSIEISFGNGAAPIIVVLNPNSTMDKTILFSAEFHKIKTKTVKVKVNRAGIIPAGFSGAGNEAWTFIDEIIVY